MINETKTAQLSAYLLDKAGGKMRYIKLIKLLYLADRESMAQSGDSLTRDRFFSMKNGPILSDTLNLLKGQTESADWSALVRTEDYYALLNKQIVVDDLDELSVFDTDVLDKVYADFGTMDWRLLCEWTHNHCAEWKDPGTSRLPIYPLDIFKALGWSAEEAEALDAQYAQRCELERVMARHG